MTQQQLVFDFLGKLNIQYVVVFHRAVLTVDEIDFKTPGSQVKNLLLKSGDRYYLLIMRDDRRANFKKIAHQLGEKRLSFATSEQLQSLMGVMPGSVTPFGLLNDVAHCVTVLIDAEIDRNAPIGFHPNVNTATVVLAYSDFVRVLKALKRDPKRLIVS
ncbi:prolyl-tRNA synthetase associated domain-containing protein [Secundilactobacillus kimchicus]|uniref:prolyl-tRNA synthetase associated domain-containing protein n=1 Tax=Secundilactobacillus kimchicus TaxID=528209 RepID=UPI0024A857A1|nr:prolyl-tRNA synthetase associated domain-containing protein [Secundilactobacillus kimchicus]